jgi:hypothetical protein
MMTYKHVNPYVRAGIVPLERVLPYLGGFRRWYCGHNVRMDSDRLMLFRRMKEHLFCVACKIKGVYFAVERHSNTHTYHLNLYAIDANGRHMLMTKDHILARSKNGKNHQSNYQVMCAKCNCKKGAKYARY